MAVASVGAVLRAERLRQGLTLAELARETRISRKFLSDIESDDFSALPGLLFARNFVRTYAAELHLDSDSLLSQLPKVDIGIAPMPRGVSRQRISRRNPRWNSAVISAAWAAVAIAAGTGAYLHFIGPNAPVKSRIAPPAPVARTVPSPVAVSAGPVVRTHPVQVVLTAHEASWVQISADGRNMFTGVLQANATQEVGADQLVKVVTGNAGGVSITLNGKAVEPLGPAGQVRTVKLTAEGPQFVLKTPAPMQQQPASDPL